MSTNKHKHGVALAILLFCSSMVVLKMILGGPRLATSVKETASPSITLVSELHVERSTAPEKKYSTEPEKNGGTDPEEQGRILDCKREETLPKMNASTVNLNDSGLKLKLLATPKGGATVTTQIMFRKLGLYDEAIKYNPWIHKYRQHVFMHKPEHRRKNCRSFCKRKTTESRGEGARADLGLGANATATTGVHQQQSWLCIKIVRSPIDRAVSSYLHSLKTKLWRVVPYLSNVTSAKQRSAHNASFADFYEALYHQAASGTLQRAAGDHHWLPQSTTDGCDDSAHLVPIETLAESLGVIGQVSDVYLDASGLTSHQYITKAEEDGPEQDMSDAPFPLATRDGKFPPYGSYFLNATINARICQMFCHDLNLYARACRDKSIVRDGSASRQICKHELEKIDTICGTQFAAQM